jgi:hypothetical protein
MFKDLASAASRGAKKAAAAVAHAGNAGVNAAKKGYEKAKVGAHKAAEAYEAAKSAAQESLDPGGMQKLKGQVREVGQDDARALQDLQKVDENKLSAEQKEKLEEARRGLQQSQDAIKDLMSGLGTVVAAVGS